jgi:uncharacterized protein (DUF1800 family)
VDVLLVKVCGMRVALLLFALAVAAPSFALTFPEARHLSLRAGFGPEADLINALLPLEKSKAVAYLLQRREADFEFPDCAQETLVPYSKIQKFEDAELKVFRQSQNECKLALKQAYAEHLLSKTSTDVLLHRMELFWHNHFTSSLDKVPHVALMFNQHNVIHKNAMGNFRVLLHSLVLDPAMLLYLDNNNNKKAKPNENLARELMELFTLGMGNYSEGDVKEVARALTGLSIDNNTFSPRFYPERHDYGKKTILGQSGHYGAAAVVEILLSQPKTAEYITRKIWLEFVSIEDDKTIILLGARFFKDWNIARLIRGILTSPPFWADSGKMTKSPLDLTVGGGRLLPGRVPVKSVPVLVRRMGQDIFSPPNVKGWSMGSAWINSQTYLERINFAELLSRGLQAQRYEEQLSFLCGRGVWNFAARLPNKFDPANHSGAIENDENKWESCIDELALVLEHPVWQLK